MKTRTFYANLLALAVGLAGCLNDPGGIIFGSGATLPGCQGGATTSTTTPAGGGGAGGSGSTTTTGGASGSTMTTSTTTTESMGGAGGSTTSSSSTTTTDTQPTCQQKACANFGLECGAVPYDCDNDGSPEKYVCATCTLPAVCGGSDIPFSCGSKCQSKYCPICQANGLPTGFCPVADCEGSYRFDPNGNLQQVAAFGLNECKLSTAPDGTPIKCCNSPF